jgi:hypothetical protein
MEMCAIIPTADTHADCLEPSRGCMHRPTRVQLRSSIHPNKACFKGRTHVTRLRQTDPMEAVRRLPTESSATMASATAAPPSALALAVSNVVSVASAFASTTSAAVPVAVASAYAMRKAQRNTQQQQELQIARRLDDWRYYILGCVHLEGESRLLWLTASSSG